MASGLTPQTRHKLLRRRNWSRGFANLVFLLASNASKPALRKAGPPRYGIIEAAYPKMRRIRYQIRLNAMQRPCSVRLLEGISCRNRQRVAASLARLTSQHGCRTPVDIPGRVALENTCFASMHLPSGNCKVDQLDGSCDEKARPNVTYEHLYLR
ncbi:hypothetical protein HDV62DRAFT_301143 [Trichoderma sp. SZMC 28011]